MKQDEEPQAQVPMHEPTPLIELIKAEIGHSISPVIGWLRNDAAHGRDDSSQERLYAYHKRLQKAAEDIVALLERRGHDTTP